MNHSEEDKWNMLAQEETDFHLRYVPGKDAEDTEKLPSGHGPASPE